MILQAVILCGGSGTRLWPLSREKYPKQLLRLTGQHTMLQATALRLHSFPHEGGNHLAAPILVGNDEYRFLIAEQLREVGVKPGGMLLEPCGRNTAPALTLAALVARAGGDDPVLAIMPADHVIQDEAAFHAALAVGARLAETGKLVTFGIRPTAPETGYGYIRLGEAQEAGVFQVAQFVEKPDTETAQAYLDSGQFLWNGGMFVIKASVWLEKIRRFRPDIAEACSLAFNARLQDLDFIRPGKDEFAACPSDSIDYAVMEPLTQADANLGEVVVVPLDARWSDVGAWNALWEIGSKDENGNVLIGDTLAVDTRNSLVLAESRLVATVGLDNVIIVETADAILVADREQIHQIREVVARLKGEARSEGHFHRKIHRPWGYYDSVDCGSRFQVKRIVVNPGGCLSLQMHHHRAEHWIVVSGTARVVKGEETFLVSENESTFIPLGTLHRLDNPGKLPLEMIEVQSGSYLGEDDIVRFEDIYGR